MSHEQERDNPGNVSQVSNNIGIVYRENVRIQNNPLY